MHCQIESSYSFICLLAFFFSDITSGKDDSRYISDFVAFPSQKVRNTTATVLPDVVNLVDTVEAVDVVDLGATAGKAGMTNTDIIADTDNTENSTDKNNTVGVLNTTKTCDSNITVAVKMEMMPVTPSPAKKPPRMSFVDEGTVDLLFDEVLKAEMYFPRTSRPTKGRHLRLAGGRWQLCCR